MAAAVVPERSPSFTGAERGHIEPQRAKASSGGAVRSPSSGWAWRMAAALLELVLRVVRSAVRGLGAAASCVGDCWRGLWQALASAQHRAPTEGTGADAHQGAARASTCAPDGEQLCTGCWRYLAHCRCPGRCRACRHPAHLPGQCDYASEEHQHGGAGRAARCLCGEAGPGAVAARTSTEAVPALSDRGLVSTTGHRCTAPECCPTEEPECLPPPPEDPDPSDTCGNARGHEGELQHVNAPAGTATHGRRSEELWRHVATLLGLTLHEAAVAAYGAQEAWGRLRLGLGRLVRALRLLAALAGLLWRVAWQTERCATCGGLLRLFSAASHCDRCAAASVPALRLEVAKLGQEVEGLTLELSEAAERVHSALERQVQAERAQEGAESGAEEAIARAASLAVELEASAEDLERLQADVAREQDRAGNWRTLFLRALALALHQHALSVRRKDRLRAAQLRLSWYRTELTVEQAHRCATQRVAVLLQKQVLEVEEARRQAVEKHLHAVQELTAVEQRQARAPRASATWQAQSHAEWLRERAARVTAERLLRRRLRAAHREGRSLRQENRRLWKAFGCHPMAPAAIGLAAYFRAGGTRP